MKVLEANLNNPALRGHGVRARVALITTAVLVAGCVAEEEAPHDDAALHVYHYVYPGSDVFVDGAPAGMGWLFRLHNPGAVAVDVQGCTHGVGPVTHGVPGAESTTTCGAAWTLAPGGATAYMVHVHGINGTPSMQFLVDGRPAWGKTIDVQVQEGAAVVADSHVQTITVGVWTNGTSFYTNIPALLQDAWFPAGGNIDVNASLDVAAPLPVYVYDADRAEQPPASRDTCHFTTIEGYNGLLRDQAAGLTSVRHITPEEAYTVAGGEEHLLYGESLIFLNTIVSIDEVLDATFSLPESDGACFDEQNTLDYYGIPVESPVP